MGTDEEYVNWDDKISNIANYRKRVRAIVDNNKCKKNADVMEKYTKLYSHEKEKSRNSIPDSKLSSILKKENHYINDSNGYFKYIENKDANILLEMIDVFKIDKGQSYSIKNYEITIDKENTHMIVYYLTEKYPDKISNINIQYINKFASIKITYKVPTSASKNETNELDISTLEKLLKEIKRKIKK